MSRHLLIFQLLKPKFLLYKRLKVVPILHLFVEFVIKSTTFLSFLKTAFCHEISFVLTETSLAFQFEPKIPPLSV